MGLGLGLKLGLGLGLAAASAAPTLASRSSTPRRSLLAVPAETTYAAW